MTANQSGPAEWYRLVHTIDLPHIKRYFNEQEEEETTGFFCFRDPDPPSFYMYLDYGFKFAGYVSTYLQVSKNVQVTYTLKLFDKSVN